MEVTIFFSRFVPDTTSLQLDSWHLDDAATLPTLHVISAQRVAPCPVCAVFAPHVHSRYERILGDLPWGVVRVRWQLPVRKYFCANVQCPPVSSWNGSLAWWLLGLGGHSAW
jgi:transposase